MFSVYDKTWTLRASYFMPSLVRVRVSERLTHNNNNNKKNMAGLYGWQVYCWNPKHPRKSVNIDVEREYRKLSCLFQNPERNNGIITESLRQLKMFIHQQSTTIMFHCFFGEILSEFEIAWEVITLFLELLQNVMKHSPRSCGYK